MGQNCCPCFYLKIKTPKSIFTVGLALTLNKKSQKFFFFFCVPYYGSLMKIYNFVCQKQQIAILLQNLTDFYDICSGSLSHE